MKFSRSVLVLAAALLAVGNGLAAHAPVGPLTLDAAWRDAERLAARHEGGEVVRVDGDSMFPFFGDGSLLVMKPISADGLQPGMVVVYRNRFDETVAHRIERWEDGDWVVRGYNNPEEDSTRVGAKNLLGVVYATFYSNGRVADPAAFAALSSGARVALAAPAR